MKKNILGFKGYHFIIARFWKTNSSKIKNRLYNNEKYMSRIPFLFSFSVIFFKIM